MTTPPRRYRIMLTQEQAKRLLPLVESRTRSTNKNWSEWLQIKIALGPALRSRK